MFTVVPAVPQVGVPYVFGVGRREEGRRAGREAGRQEAAGREGERKAGGQWGREHFLSGDVT